MSNRVKSTPLRQPMLIFLLLTICTCSLAVHFLAEGLILEIQEPAQELADQMGEHANSFHEHSEDQFIYSFLGVTSFANLLLPTLLPIISRRQSLSISPQLPPPNL